MSRIYTTASHVYRSPALAGIPPLRRLFPRAVRWVLVVPAFLLCGLVACGNQAGVPPSSAGAAQIFEAAVLGVTRGAEADPVEGEPVHEIVQVEITGGARRGEQFTLDSNTIYVPGTRPLAKGDAVVLEISTDPDGVEFAYISDYVRRTPLYILFGVFVVATLLIARRQGLASLFGMGISFVIIFQFIVPQILAGTDPLVVVILGAVLIIAITFYLSHGLNRKTTAAVLGTLLALVLTGVIANLSIAAARLSGFGLEETMFLARETVQPLNIQGLYLAGILIGLLGILDDITVSQAAIVWQLKEAQPALQFPELYRRAMSVGKDHIASLVNTLVLVYAGASLPLLLLFNSHAVSFGDAINYESIAEEIVRTLVASVGLIVAVPLTTLITALWAMREGQPAPYPPGPHMPGNP